MLKIDCREEDDREGAVRLVRSIAIMPMRGDGGLGQSTSR